MKVVKVKKSDKGDFYKRQQTWELRDLTEVDAKDASKVRKRSGLFLNLILESKALLYCESGAGCFSSLFLSVVFVLHYSGLFPFLVLKPNLLYAKFQCSTDTLFRWVGLAYISKIDEGRQSQSLQISPL